MPGAFLSVVLGAALKGAPVLVIVLLAVPLLRRRSAAVRHAVWTFAVGTQLVLPALTAVAPSWGAPLVEQPAWLTDARAAVEPVGVNAGPTGMPSRSKSEDAPSGSDVAGGAPT